MAFYRLFGGATRPDAISGLNPQFNAAITKLFNAAPPEVQAELGLTSGYRSPEVQRRLWEASDKSGHMVAAPGHSKHNAGLAADLYGMGTGGGNVSQATRDWVHQNAGQYGLYFPMKYEPWHIQWRGDAGGAAPADAGGGTAVSTAGAQSATGGAPAAPASFGQQVADRFNASPGMQMVNKIKSAFTGEPAPAPPPAADGSEQKPQSIGGVLGQVASSLGGGAQQSPMSVPDLLPQGGGGQQQGGSLQDYIQKYIATRMQGQGGQGIG